MWIRWSENRASVFVLLFHLRPLVLKQILILMKKKIFNLFETTTYSLKRLKILKSVGRTDPEIRRMSNSAGTDEYNEKNENE